MGAVSPIGGCSAVSAIAARCGLSRITMQEDPSGESYHLARTAMLDGELAAPERVLRMLQSVLQETLGELVDHLDRGLRMPLFIAAPQWLATCAGTMPELPYAARWSEMEWLTEGQAAGLLGLQMALQRLQGASGGLACVAGVDVRSSLDAIAALRKEGRLHTENHPWGMVPGEGAGALLLATESMCRQLKLKSLGTITAVGSADEDAYRRGVPCIGSGLTRACHAAIGAIGDAARVSEIYCDLNGERARSDEWGFTAPRISKHCYDVSRFVAPAMRWGDLGSATSILLTQLALIELNLQDASREVALVWSASDAGHRAAALLRRSRESTSPPQMHIPDRSTQEQLFDIGVVEELRADASFLFEQRMRRRHDLELAPAAELSFSALEAGEQRLELQIQGLVALSCLTRMACQSPATGAGDIYAATRVLAEGAGNVGLRAFVEQLGLEGEDAREPLEAALTHSARHLSESVVEDMSMVDLRLSVHLAAVTGYAPKASWHDLARQGPRQLGVTLPAALVRFNVKFECLRLLSPWLNCDQSSERLAAMTALLRLDPNQGRDFLLHCVPSEPVFVARLLSARAEDVIELERQLLDWQDTDSSTLMLGLLGTRRASGRLVQLLLEAPDAAAAALHLITGKPLFETETVEDRVDDNQLTYQELVARRAGDTTVGIERSAIRRFARSPVAWRQALDEIFAGQDATERFRLGASLSRESLFEATAHPLLAPSVQNLMREELALRYSVSLPQRMDWRIAEWRDTCRELMGSAGEAK